MVQLLLLKQRFYIILLCLLIMACSTSKEIVKAPTPIAPKEAVDLLLIGGTILTMEEEQPQVEAIAIREDKIVWIGLEKDIGQLDATEIVYLKEQTLMPGLIQQHLHPTLGALTLSVPVIAPEDWELPSKIWKAAKNEEEYRQILKKEVQQHTTEGTFFSWGYHQYFHGDLSRAVLDDISDTTVSYTHLTLPTKA